MTALLPGIFLFWFGTVYELRLASYGLKPVLKMPRMLGHQLLGLLFNCFGRGTYSQATPGLLNACICE